MQCADVIHRRCADDHERADDERAVHIRQRQPQIGLQTLVGLLVKLQDLDLFTPKRVHHTNGTEPFLGLREHGEKTGMRHIISTAIAHKAVLEPLEFLERHGFEMTLIKPGSDGVISTAEVRAALRPETLQEAVEDSRFEMSIDFRVFCLFCLSSPDDLVGAVG